MQTRLRTPTIDFASPVAAAVQVDSKRQVHSGGTQVLVGTMGELERQVEDAISKLTIMPLEMEHRYPRDAAAALTSHFHTHHREFSHTLTLTTLFQVGTHLTACSYHAPS